jgi:ribosomal protein RSM22 (predicted rRNA methylase)
MDHFKHFQDFILAKGRIEKIKKEDQKFLTHVYTKTKNRSSSDLSKRHILTYCMTRSPATYAVIKKCLRELPVDFSPQSVLDLGCGPLTAYFALLEEYRNFSYTGIEPHPDMYTLALDAKKNFDCSITLHNTKLESFLPTQNAYDLVIASYVLNEISVVEPVLSLILEAVQNFGLIILPGTPKDFEILEQIRTAVLNKNFHIIAPCATQKACPLLGQKDRWCHFGAHVERLKEHKTLKEGDLSFEIEKFSYVLFSKKNIKPKSRLMSSVHKKTNHLSVELCTIDGLKKEIVTKKDKDLYKKIKKMKWGDGF